MKSWYGFVDEMLARRFWYGAKKQHREVIQPTKNLESLPMNETISFESPLLKIPARRSARTMRSCS